MVGTKERKAVGEEVREVSGDLIHGMKEQRSFQLASDEKLTRLISLWYPDAEKVCCCWVLLETDEIERGCRPRGGFASGRERQRLLRC